MGLNGIRVVRVWPGENGAAWLPALQRGSFLAADLPVAASIYKQEGTTWVASAHLFVDSGPVPQAVRSVVIKSRPIPNVVERVKCLLGAGRADRQWRGAAWLLEHGFRSARPHVILRGRCDGVLREWLVMETVPGRTALEHLASRDLTVREEHAAAAEAGRMVARLVGSGRMNRDCKPSNLILLNAGSHGPEIAMIDTVAVRRILLRRRGLTRMLAAMVIEAIGTGNRPRRALMARALREAVKARAPGLGKRAAHSAAADLWCRVAALVEKHGDPTPRVYPLKPTLPTPPEPNHAGR